MLPTVQKALELRRRHWLDFAAQLAECEPVDARQDAAIAPFHRVWLKRGRITSAHGLAFRFELQQSGVDFVARKRKHLGE
jgi:hypothetical protein